MSLRKNKLPLHILVAVPVFTLILAASVLAVAAMIENLHFINATNQILDLVGQVRMLATDQKTFAAAPGADLWAELARSGQIAPGEAHLNPWKESIRATTVAEGMRLESDLPARDCRRMALYFLDKQPQALGLLSIEAQPLSGKNWNVIYPAPGLSRHGAEMACGRESDARLALILKIR